RELLWGMRLIACGRLSPQAMFFSPAPRAEKNATSVTRQGRVLIRYRSKTAASKMLSLVICFMPVAIQAGLIHWGSPGFVDNADSRGRQWDGGYSMEAGIFSDGFVPTFENREQWTGHWRLLGIATYDGEEKRFAGVINTEAYLVPAGSAIYFW